MNYHFIISVIIILATLFHYYQLWKSSLIFLIVFSYFLLKNLTKIEAKIGYKDIKPSIMVIIGSGGHTWEIINIISKLQWENYLPIYIIGYSDYFSLNDIIYFEKKFERKFFYERIIRPREHHHYTYSITVFFRTIYCFLKSFQLILRHKPDYILANGPSICVPIILCGWFLKKLKYINTKILFIESAARVNSLSISAKLIRNYVDNMFGCWKELCYTFGITSLNSSEIFKQNINLSNQGKKNDKEVLVTVGSTGFEKLIELVLTKDFQNLLINNGYNKLNIQIGNYKLNQKYFNEVSKLKIKIFTFLSSIKFDNIIKNSDLIICHGGAGTLIQSIKNGKKPIAIANEFVSENHQKELINYFQSHGYIYTCKIEHFLDYIKSNISNLLFNNNVIYEFDFNKVFLDSIGESDKKKNYLSNFSDLDDKRLSIAIPSIYKDIFKLQNLLFSINEYVSYDLIKTIFIIVPDNELTIFTSFNFFENDTILKTKISIIKESELIPINTFSKKNYFFFRNKNGWFKQQMLKLAISFQIKTKFYLILDSDCVFIKSFQFSDAFLEKNNSILSYLQEEEIFIHDKWWKGSAKLLGITEPFLNSLKNGIGVTPQILSVEIVKELCHFIESKSEKEKWYSILWSNRIQIYPPMIWTEYTLYYLFAVRTGIFDNYHVLKKNCIANYNGSVWELHHSFEWNPTKSYMSSPIVIFQSNTNLSHLFTKALITQNNKNTKNFISCIMVLEKKIVSNYEKNAILLGINCFITQIWEKTKRELIIFCFKENKNIILELINHFNNTNENIYTFIINDKNNIYKSINENIKGNYIAFWPLMTWSSPYRLSIQYNYLKENNKNECYISPFINAYPNNEKYLITKENINLKLNIINSKISLFYKKNNNFEPDLENNSLNEPTIFIKINYFQISFKNNDIDAPNYLQKKNQQSLLYELKRITNPFLFNKSIMLFRPKKRIYIVSSELEFYPVIGGINTFLRVILSELSQTQILVDNNIEFVFLGIQVGTSSPIVPEIKGVFFKFFPTDKSKEQNSLNNYFKSFKKYSQILEDLQKFGKKAIDWVEIDSIPGDILVSTIVYELNRQSLEDLNKKGVKIVHTVHSLVPLKIINNLKKISLSRLSIKERIAAIIFFKILRFNEYSIKKVCKNYFIKKIIPNFANFIIEIEDFIMNISKTIIVPSKKLAEITAKIYSDSKHKIQYIPWGLPEKEIFGEPLISVRKKSSEEIEEKSIIKCVALCKIIPQKGINILLDSFYYIEKFDPIFAKKLELNICGDMAYMEDKGYKNLLDEKVKKIKIIKINFKGWIIGDKKIELLTNSDLFLLPSLTEPFGFCILEAMKAGLPIISFNTEGPSDIVTNKFGRIVQFSDYDTMMKDFAYAIIDICQTGNLNNMGMSAVQALKEWKSKNFVHFLISD